MCLCLERKRTILLPWARGSAGMVSTAAPDLPASRSGQGHVRKAPMLKYVSRYIATAGVLFCLWLLLTSNTNVQEVVAGAVLALFVAALGCKGFTRRGLGIFSPRRLAHMLMYLPVFFWEMIKANFDVAYRVVHPRMPIRPGIVVIKTELTSDIGKLFLANSITLTPGTLTLDVQGEYLFIHWINVKDEDVERASQLIGGRFEKHLKAICE